MSHLKKALITAFILPVLFFILSCSPEKESTISGVIQNLKEPHITINGQMIKVSSEGQFRHTAQLEKPEYFTLDFGEEIELYLYPGDLVEVKIDAERGLKSIKLSGSQQDINQHLLLQSQESLKLNEYFNKELPNIVRMEESDFVEKINSLWKPFNERLESLIEEKKINDANFISTEHNASLYSQAKILMRYPNWHRQVGGATDYTPSEHFYDFVNELDLNNPALLGEEEYIAFLNSYFDFKTDGFLEKSSEFENRNYKRFRAQMKTALELFDEPKVLDEMLFSFMSLLLTDYSHKGIDDLFLTFKQNCSNSNYIEEIENLYQEDQAVRDACSIQVYKTIDDVQLDVFVYKPSDLKEGERRPAVAFFHGGGWECGKPEWGQMQCEHFSSMGLVAFSFEYRLSTQHDTTPIESLKDTKSAIRWIRKNAEELGVDPEKIIGSGYSAGGHLVMCTAMVEGYEEFYENQSISSAVNAMMLWVTPAIVYPGWFTNLLRGKAELREFNPINLIKPGLPPAIFFQGTADDTVPLQSVESYVKKARAAGNRCDLELYEGQTHLNWSKNSNDVLKKMDAFLVSLGYLKEDRI